MALTGFTSSRIAEENFNNKLLYEKLSAMSEKERAEYWKMQKETDETANKITAGILLTVLVAFIAFVIWII